MKQKLTWMFAAILTICGATMLSSCSDNTDNPVDNQPVTERATFEKQLSTTLAAASAEQKNLESSTHAAQVLTAFVENLNMEALADQLLEIMNSVLSNAETIEFANMGDQEAEAREALKNTFSKSADAEEFILVNAQAALGGIRMTFTEGEKKMNYETGIGEDLVIAYLNPTNGESTELKLRFDNPVDGVSLFIANVVNAIPVAIKFPAAINLTVNHTDNGVQKEVLNGIVTLVSPSGQKYVSLRKGDWDIAVMLGTTLNDRFELPAARIHHFADGTIEANASIFANSSEVLGLSVNSVGTPYSDEKMEELKEMRQDGPVFAAFYELLSMFNHRTGDAQLTLMNDLVFDINLTDIANAASAFGKSIRLRHNGGNPTQADIDPLVEELNKSLTFSVSQKSTGITADGKLMTAKINDHLVPALALRFKGESEFQVMNYNLTDADRENYNALMHSFDAPGRQLQKLFDAFVQKRDEFNEFNPFKF